MRCRLIPVLIFLFAASFAYAERWEYHLPWYGVRDFAIRGDYAWGAGIYSIIRWDIRDGSYIQYSRRDLGVENIPWRIAVDTRGEVWVGYLSGGKISRFDGSRWNVIDQSAIGLPGAGIQSILADRAGNIWFGTSSAGVVRFDGSAWFQYAPGYTVPPSEAPLSMQILDMAEDRDGTVWFGGDRGLSRFDGISWKTWTEADGLPGDNVTGVRAAENGVIWCIAGGALVSFEGERFTTHPAPVQEDIRRAPYFYGSLAIAPDGTIWTDEVETRLKSGTREPYAKGVWRFREGVWDLVPLNPGGTENYTIGKVYAAPGGSLWFTTARELVCRNGETERILRAHGPSSTLHAEIARDRNGVFWFSGVSTLSSESSNVARYDGTTWETFDLSHAPNITAARIELDERDRLWFFHQGDLVSIDRDSLTIELPGREFPARGISDFALADSRTAWFSDRENGIYAWRNGLWEHHSMENGLASNMVHTISPAPDGTVWAGTAAGVSRFDGHSWQNWPLARPVIQLAFGKKGEVWGAGYGSLFRFDGTEWKDLGSFTTSRPGSFVSLAVDANNTLWACSWYEGVLRFDGWKWKWYTEADGLLAKRTSAVAVDSHNRKWFATEAGICVLEDSLTAVSETTPAPFALHGNYPNPFNPGTTISFTLPETGRVSLVIYSISGQKVRELLSDNGAYKSPGTYTPCRITWDGKDDSGKPVSSGVYIARLQAGKETASRKMLLMK